MNDDETDQRTMSVAGKVLDGDPCLLGDGFEGKVYTDGVRVCKVFTNTERDYRTLVSEIGDLFTGCTHFYEAEGRFVDGFPVIVYPYEGSEPYTGGMEAQMQEFLSEAASRGICIQDVKPRNLRVAGGNLRFIDYGWDMVSFSMERFLFMAQRAYLCCKVGEVTGFRELAHRAIRDWDLPELDGFADFFNGAYELMRQSRPLDGENPTALVLSQDDWAEDMRVRFLRQYEDGTFADMRAGFDDGDLSGLSSGMGERDRCLLLVPNPFFGNECSLEPLSSQLLSHSLSISKSEDSPARPDGELFRSDYTALYLQKVTPTDRKVSLLIKTCFQDADVVEENIRHIVRQLEQPDFFEEKVVSVDCKREDFLRSYSEPDETKLTEALDRLVSDGTIDRYIAVPDDPELFREINMRWFGVECSASHSIGNVPVASQLYAFEQCRNNLILQCDCDVMVVRRDRAHSYLGDMVSVIDRDRRAVSVGFNIAHDIKSKFKPYRGDGKGGYVPEVRICLLDRSRLASLCPMVNEVVDGRLALTWYRSAERSQALHKMHSVRGGDPRTFYIHPMNTTKSDRAFCRYVMDCCEMGTIPVDQFENVDLWESRESWYGRRKERFVFVTSGRNMTNGMFLRCWQSIASQTRDDWGAVIVDDASEGNLHEYILHATRKNAGKVTFVRNRERRGMLANVKDAISKYCADPNSIIVIVDMDDMLLSANTLHRLRTEYLRGHDMVAGIAVKSTRGILPFVPDFGDPRNRRMGDVWIHLRSFYKYLFDSVRDEDFRDSDGKFIDHFTELAYTVPIAEMASNPVHQKWPVYYWEPRIARSPEHYENVERSKELVRSHGTYTPEDVRTGPGPIPAGMYCNNFGRGKVLFIRHGEKEGRNPEAGLDEAGREEANALGANLREPPDLLLVSPSDRTVETAECIRSGTGKDIRIVQIPDLRGVPVTDRVAWSALKHEHGRTDTLELWKDGGVSEEVLPLFREVGISLLGKIWKEISRDGSESVMIVTHDHYIRYITLLMGEMITTKVHYLDGVMYDLEDVYTRLVSLISEGRDMSTCFETDTDRIEVDITYRCDLGCLNCDRSCNLREDAGDMSSEDIRSFLEKSESVGKEWKRIRIMGGEPRLHPQFDSIMQMFGEYRQRHPDTLVEVFTNGLDGELDLPDGLVCHNTSKSSVHNGKFDPYHLAPKDIAPCDDYSAGCWITNECGMGLNHLGYYPCAAGAALDEYLGLGLASDTFEMSEDQLRSQKSVLCSLCGHFNSRNYQEHEDMPSPMHIEPVSRSWKGDLNES